MTTNNPEPKKSDPTESHLITADLSRFQLETLYVLADSDDGLYGLAIKDALEALYGHEHNHGRLYPNLDELADRGLIQKEEQTVDDRTNTYQLTPLGESAVTADIAYRQECGTDE